MTKLYFIVIVAITFSVLNPKQMQGQAFTNHSMYFSAGYGFVTFNKSVTNIFGYYGDVSSKQFGPIYIKVERGVYDFIGLGISFAYVESTWGLNYYNYNGNNNPIEYTDNHTRTSYSVMGRINFHGGSVFGSKKVDPYGGFGMGYRDVSWKISTNNPNGVYTNDIEPPFLSHVAFEITVGVRYLITPHFQVYTELGGSKSVVQIGAAFYLPGIVPAEPPLIHP